MDVRFNMRATVLNKFSDYTSPNPVPDVDAGIVTGHWRPSQDPDTGAVSREWVPDNTPVPAVKDMGTDWRVKVNRFEIECYVRGFPEVGFRSSANAESWEDGIYRAMEMIQMVFPAKYVLSRRQLVTNIRGRNDNVFWLEEETGQPTVFEVQGVTPTFDPFGRHIDNLTVLKRADIQ